LERPDKALFVAFFVGDSQRLPTVQQLLEEKQRLEASGSGGELESTEALEEELKQVCQSAPC